MDPGCKVDTVLTLVGSQGVGKSTIPNTLFGNDWFSDNLPKMDTDKRTYASLHGHWCMEISMRPNEIRTKIDNIRPYVQKPGRYTGGELNQVVKGWETTPLKVPLAFPDIYDLEMAN